MKDTEIETINNSDNCIQVCLKNLKDNSSSILDGKHIFSCLPSHILSKLFNNENSNEYNQTRNTFDTYVHKKAVTVENIFVVHFF